MLGEGLMIDFPWHIIFGWRELMEQFEHLPPQRCKVQSYKHHGEVSSRGDSCCSIVEHCETCVLWNMMFLPFFVASLILHRDTNSKFRIYNLIWTMILKSYLILGLSTQKISEVKDVLTFGSVLFCSTNFMNPCVAFSHPVIFPLCLKFSRRHATCVAGSNTSACFADGTSASWAISRLQLHSYNPYSSATMNISHHVTICI